MAQLANIHLTWRMQFAGSRSRTKLFLYLYICARSAENNIYYIKYDQPS